MNIETTVSSWFSNRNHSDNPIHTAEVSVCVRVYHNRKELGCGFASRDLDTMPDMTFGELKGSTVWAEMVSEATGKANQEMDQLFAAVRKGEAA